jgi:sialate O-acetylesterase
MTRVLVLFFSFLYAHSIFANVQLPKIFGDHMVLQRDKNIVVWGWADPKEKITIQLNKQSVAVVAGKDGQWKAMLKSEAAGGPYQLIVKGKNSIILNDILIGDVWICSGQSNMEWPVKNSKDAAMEIQNANYPSIRQIKIPNTMATEPQKDIKGGEWKVCSSATVGEFTAVGYFFARQLTSDLSVPIGLINTSWGGTHSETWTSRKAFEESEEFKNIISGMPRLNLDSLSKQKRIKVLERFEKVHGKLPQPEEVNAWKEIDFNDASWNKMEIPMLWEYQALGNFDGFVWFRKTVTLKAQDIGKPASLELALIDDNDDTFVNGIKIGSTQRPNEKRIYTIPPGTLKEGNNVIAVRVEDTGGGGGINGSPSDLVLKIGEATIPLAGKWPYRVEAFSSRTSGVGPNDYPTLLFNAMISPIIPMAMKGVIWYQGETNADRAYQYRKAFPLMISDWRKHWAQGDFPFYFVQLASYNANKGNSEKGSTWAELREAQTLTLSLPNTGMAVTTDIGDANDIHPRNKQDVGKRLAALALSKTYEKNTVCSGPVYKSMEVKGNEVIITFSNIGGGLLVKDRYGYVMGFEVAGADRKFKYAKGVIQGNTIVVSCAEVPTPVAIRFGWADNASDCNVFNAEGFPVVPFRTDEWKGITEENKFSFPN